MLAPPAVVVVALTTAAIFAMGVFAPSISCNKQLYLYERYTIQQGQSIAKDVLSTLNAYKTFAYQNTTLPNLNQTKWQAMNKSINAYISNGTKFLTYKSYGSLNPQTTNSYLSAAITLMASTSITTLGQAQTYPTAKVCNDNSTLPMTFNQACKAPQPMKAIGSTYGFNITTV